MGPIITAAAERCWEAKRDFCLSRQEDRTEISDGSCYYQGICLSSRSLRSPGNIGNQVPRRLVNAVLLWSRQDLGKWRKRGPGRWHSAVS